MGSFSIPSTTQYRFYAVTATDKWVSRNVSLSPGVDAFRRSVGLPNRLIYLSPRIKIEPAIRSIVQKYSTRTTTCVMDFSTPLSTEICLESEGDNSNFIKLLAFWVNDDDIEKIHKAINVLELVDNQMIIFTFDPVVCI